MDKTNVWTPKILATNLRMNSHKETLFKRPQNQQANQATNQRLYHRKHVETTSYIPICWPLKCVKNKLLSSLTFKHKLPRKMRQRQYHQTITWWADLIESPSTERRRNCIQKQYLQVAKQGHIQQWTRRNQAAVTRLMRSFLNFVLYIYQRSL